MWIKRAIFTNFGPHRRLDLQFNRGLNGIFGFNGKGKSTITDGIYSCITNDFGRFPGVKDDCICSLSTEDEESSVYVEIEHNDVVFQIYRGLRTKRGTPANSLEISDGRKFTKAPEIMEVLGKELRINKALLDAYVFVKQRGMFDFLSATSGDRAKTYQQLCGTGKAKTICEAIDKLLQQDAELSAPIADNSDDLLQKIAARDVELTTASAEMATASEGLLTPERLAVAKASVLKRDNRVRLRAELSVLDTNIASRQKDVDRAQMSVTRRHKLFTDATEAVNALQPLVDAARTNKTLLKQSKEAEVKRAGLQTRLQQLQTVLKAKKVPVLHPEDPNRAQYAEELAAIQNRYDRLLELEAALDADGLVECPTCGTPVAAAHAHLKERKKEEPKLLAELNNLHGIIDLVDACRGIVGEYQTFKATQDRLIHGVESQLKAIAETAPPVFDEGEADADIQAFVDQGKVLDQARDYLGEAKGELAGATGRLQSDQKRRETVLSELEKNKGDDKAATNAVAAIERHDTAKVLVAQAEGRYNGLKQLQDRDEEDLKQLRARLARGAKARKFGARMAQLRDEVFHRQKLPQMVAQMNLEDMEADINATLQQFGGPFWVETSEDLLFTVHFPGEPPRSAERLSVGQKGVLAVAFRPALQQLFDADIDMLCMDEPTADFDARNVQLLGVALQAYADNIRGKRQVIMVTHANALRGSFDNVIDLGSREG